MLDGLIVIASAAVQPQVLVVQPVQPRPVVIPPATVEPQVRPVIISPVVEDISRQVRVNLPDLVIGNVRRTGPETIEVEVKNQGGAAAAGPIRVTATGVSGMGHYPTPDRRLGSLAAGESRWVAFDCFAADQDTGFPAKPGRLSDCAPLLSSSWKIDEVWVNVDRWQGTTSENREVKRATAHCNYEQGCITELNEDNNSRVVEIRHMGERG